MTLTEEQIERYARQIVMRQIGGVGQERLLGATVFLLGAGGLGSPVAYYLAAAGIGHLIIADGDRVERSNLQRQILHTSGRIGTFKAESAAHTLRELNPGIRVTPVTRVITADNVAEWVEASTLVVDGSDSFDTRFLLNDWCRTLHKPLVSGAVLGFEGQVATFRHGLDPMQPCYRCLHPDPPTAGMAPTCATAGVLGAVAGMVGCQQAIETVKELLGIGDSLSGSVLLINTLDGVFQRIRLRKNPDCPACAPRGTALQAD